MTSARPLMTPGANFNNETGKVLHKITKLPKTIQIMNGPRIYFLFLRTLYCFLESHEGCAMSYMGKCSAFLPTDKPDNLIEVMFIKQYILYHFQIFQLWLNHISTISCDRKLDISKVFKSANISARNCTLTGALGSSMIELQTTARFSADRSIVLGKIAKSLGTKKNHQWNIVTWYTNQKRKTLAT